MISRMMEWWRVERPWKIVAADVIGPLPRNKAGHCYLLVIQDLFTKWIKVNAMRTATGKLIREAVQDFIGGKHQGPS